LVQFVSFHFLLFIANYDIVSYLIAKDIKFNAFSNNESILQEKYSTIKKY